jgi:hypothetical protein
MFCASSNRRFRNQGAAQLRLLVPAEPVPDPAPPVVVTVRCRRYGRRDLAQLGLRINVIIAALNEERNLLCVFARRPHGLHEVIIVDGTRRTGWPRLRAPFAPAWVVRAVTAPLAALARHLWRGDRYRRPASGMLAVATA